MDSICCFGTFSGDFECKKQVSPLFKDPEEMLNEFVKYAEISQAV